MKTIYKLAIKIFSLCCPRRVVDFAYYYLTNPQVKKLRAYELDILNCSNKEYATYKKFKFPFYTWQGGDKKVLLIHGWEGQAGNFKEIIEALLKHGYTVYAFDAPAHGFSSKGRITPNDFIAVVEMALRKYQVKNLISHSFGGVATTFVLHKNKDIKIENYVLLTTPDKFIERIDSVADKIGISAKIKEMLIQKIEEENNIDVYSLNVSDFVRDVQVAKALILHDKNDRVIAIECSKNVQANWGGVALLEEIEGTGHFRILRTASVIDRVVHFLEENTI